MTENRITAIAAKQGRNYITPEDVTQAFNDHQNDPHGVRIDLLEVLGSVAGFGAEDAKLCAFIGFQGWEP